MESNKSNAIIDSKYVKMDMVDEGIDYARDTNWVKLDSASAGEISQLLRIVPAAVLDKALSGTYRVVFPTGVGELIQHGDGFLAILRDPETKKILEHGTLYSLDDLRLALKTFELLSVLTSQYYLHEINQQLRDIQARLSEILDFLYTDKACEIFSYSQAVFGIYQNYVSIMNCPEQRVSSLQTIQSAKIIAERNIQFYYRDMDKIAKKGGNINGLRDNLQNYTQAVNLYSICTVMEIFLSQNFDKKYLDYIEKDLSRHVDDHNRRVGELRGVLIAPKPTKPLFNKPDQDKARQKLLEEIDAILGEHSPVKGFGDIISRIRLSYTTNAEYRVTSNGAVYRKIH